MFVILGVDVGWIIRWRGVRCDSMWFVVMEFWGLCVVSNRLLFWFVLLVGSLGFGREGVVCG